MQEKIRKFFGSELTFLWSIILTWAFQIFAFVTALNFRSYKIIPFLVLQAACVLGVFLCNRDDDMREMKNLHFVLLGLDTSESILDLVESFENKTSAGIRVFDFLLVFTMLIFFVLHNLLSSKKSKKVYIRYLQLTAILYVLFLTVSVILLFCSRSVQNLMTAISYIGSLFVLSLHLSVDMKFGFFRKKRPRPAPLAEPGTPAEPGQ